MSCFDSETGTSNSKSQAPAEPCAAPAGRQERTFSNSSLMGLTKVLDTYSAASLPSSIARCVDATCAAMDMPEYTGPWEPHYFGSAWGAAVHEDKCSHEKGRE